MLWQRVVTALLLLPLILGAIFFLPNDWFALAMVVPVLIAGREWAAMAKVCKYTFPALLLVALALMHVAAGAVATAVPAATTALSPLATGVLTVTAFFWLVALYLVVRYPAVTAWAKNRALMYAVGLLLLVPAWYAVVHLQGMGGWVLLGAFVIVWGADVGAYFAGRAFGKRKLAPAVSPGKSVEGAVGGALLTLAIAFGVAQYLGLSMAGTVQLLVLVFVATLASILGDLFESMVKREAGVKDSGTLLPGHGGMLDRIDSVTCAMPVFVLGLSLVTLA